MDTHATYLRFGHSKGVQRCTVTNVLRQTVKHSEISEVFTSANGDCWGVVK